MTDESEPQGRTRLSAYGSAAAGVAITMVLQAGTAQETGAWYGSPRATSFNVVTGLLAYALLTIIDVWKRKQMTVLDVWRHRQTTVNQVWKTHQEVNDHIRLKEAERANIVLETDREERRLNSVGKTRVAIENARGNAVKAYLNAPVGQNADVRHPDGQEIRVRPGSAFTIPDDPRDLVPPTSPGPIEGGAQEQ